MRRLGRSAAWKPTFLVLALFLGGCTAAQQAVLSTGVAHARQAKDTEATLLKAGLCAMSIGAYHRANTDIEQRAIDVLCGGQWQRPVTADDIRDLGELMRAAE